MSKRNMWILVAVGVVIVAAGVYAIAHKSTKPTASTNSTSQTNAPAVNNAVIITKTDSSLGQYLADPSGRALYTYGADTSGVSNCTGSCIVAWPAYQAMGSTTGLPTGVSTIKRTDNGQVQYTYNGMPLYYFASDTGTKVTGNGVENFQVAKPASSPSTTTSPSSSTPSSNNNSSGNPY